jgi:surface-anchored protein
VLYNSGDGLPDAKPLAVGAHTHADWAFNAAGTYTVTFRVSGTLARHGHDLHLQGPALSPGRVCRLGTGAPGPSRIRR